MAHPLVEILLSTHNGEKYLNALLDSICCQTYDNWRVLIRDDLSNDKTLEIILDYKNLYPDKFLIIDNFDDNCILHLGPSLSFGRLLETSTADYLAFCDQDDLWIPDKLELQMKTMMDTETSAGKTIPILVHSDMMLCNDQMDIMAASFWNYQNILPEPMGDIRSLPMQNFVTGCTILINKALCRLSIPIPAQALMFDWWLALMAAETGKIVSVPFPLVMYRQHSNNAVGAKKWGIKHLISKLLEKDGFWNTSLPKTKMQAQALYRHLKTKGYKDCHEIRKYTELHQITWILKKILYLLIGVKRYLKLSRNEK